MNSQPATLAEGERQRLLRVMGFSVWLPRGSTPLPNPVVARTRIEKKSAPSFTAPDVPAVARERRPPVSIEQPPEVVVAPAARSVPLRTAQTVMLILERRVHADQPLVKQLTMALPGCTICTPDTVSRGARFAVQLGVDATLPVDVLGVRAPSLEELQRSASSRRALWWSIKPILRALRH